MSDTTNISGIWRGYLSGTNRGEIFVRFQQCGNLLKADALALDFQFGPTIAQLQGKLEGHKAEMRFLRFRADAPIIPLDGQVTFAFDDKIQTADGNWSTDIGSTGVCKLLRTAEWEVRWHWRLRRIRLGWFVKRWRNTAYCAFIFFVAVAAMRLRVQMTWQTLILLLLPAPFLFSPHLARLLSVFQSAKVKKIGPIEIEQFPPSPEIIAASSQNVQESVAFHELNRFFVLRTKILMGVLAHGNGMTLADFGQYARAFGVAPENIEMTLAAILQTGCAQLANQTISPTPWGQRYVRFGLRLA
jgi:hypothetical protein